MLLRTVVEEHNVSQDIDHASKIFSRIADIFEGLKWRLARNPEGSGVPIPGFEGLMLVKTGPWSINGGAVITAIYRYDQNSVEILSVRVQNVN